jgi:hypothetical protein
MVLQPVMRVCELLGAGGRFYRLVVWCLDAAAGPRKLLPLPDIGAVNFMIVGDTVWTEETLQIFLVCG